MLLKEYSSRAKYLKTMKKKLEDEYLDFYANLVMNLSKIRPQKLYVIGFFEEKNNTIYDVEEGVVIENGTPYYINKERGLKEKLRDLEEIKLAIKETLGELLLLGDPQRVVSNVLSQLVRDKNYLRAIGLKR